VLASCPAFGFFFDYPIMYSKLGGLLYYWMTFYGDKQERLRADIVDPESKTIQITIDDNSGIPIWLQLRNRLIYLITSGQFATDDKLPTVRELAVDLGINYNTVSKVYQDIERDGYIVSYRGKGTFVSDRYLENDGVAENEADSLADDFIRQCREMGVPRQSIVELVERRLKDTGVC